MNRPTVTICLAAALATSGACAGDSRPTQVAASGPAASAVPHNEAPPAENDPQRTSWRIDVSPSAVLGSGRPGKGDTDFDKPDGVAFTPTGLLLATDAKNRRVQVWDVKTGVRVGEFGHGTFGGEIVDVAVAPSGFVLITDQTLNLAYEFVPPSPGAVDPDTGKPLGPADYQFKGTRFGEQGFDKLGGIAIDSRNRVYCVDAHLNDVRRFTPDFAADPSWHFARQKPGGDTYLHGCEGIAIDEASHDLFISSEKDAVIQDFDSETGRYKQRLIGAGSDGSGSPKGKHVFYASVEGLAIAEHHLLAVDEAAGHIQVFDLARPSAFDTDLVSYSSGGVKRSGGYAGFFGHAPRVDFENKQNVELQKQVKDGTVSPGQENPPGYFCSPDSIATWRDPAGGETYIAVADQCNYRITVYTWSEVAKVIGPSQPADLAHVIGDVAPAATPPAKPAPAPTQPVAHARPAHDHAAPAARPDKKEKKDKKGKKHAAR